MRFEDEVVLITGGGGGIGREMAIGFGRRGASVAVMDIDAQAAESTAEAVRETEAAALAVRCDVRAEAELEASGVRIEQELGPVSILCNHAGTSLNGPMDKVGADDWLELLDMNVVSMVRALRVFLPGMLRRRHGHLVFTTSSLAVFSGHPLAGMAAPYITSKAAIIGLAQSAASAVRSSGVGVSLYAPEYTDTAFPRKAKRVGYDAEDEPAGEEIATKVPYPPQTPVQAAAVLFEALAADRFLASATPGWRRLLREQADAGLDPAGLSDAYFDLARLTEET